MKTILVVDDEQPIREMLQTLLQEEGYQAMAAAHGKEGLTLMEAHLPDLVLCDVMMPVCDGREMVRRMRLDPRLAAVPVVLMSAGSLPAGIATVDYAAILLKPFDLFELLDLVERLLAAG